MIVRKISDIEKQKKVIYCLTVLSLKVSRNYLWRQIRDRITNYLDYKPFSKRLHNYNKFPMSRSSEMISVQLSRG